MATYSVRPLTRVDIDGIWDYVADDSHFRADEFLDRMIAKFSLLAIEPGLGRFREDLMPELQSFPFERYESFIAERPTALRSCAYCTAPATHVHSFAPTYKGAAY